MLPGRVDARALARALAETPEVLNRATRDAVRQWFNGHRPTFNSMMMAIFELRGRCAAYHALLGPPIFLGLWSPCTTCTAIIIKGYLKTCGSGSATRLMSVARPRDCRMGIAVRMLDSAYTLIERGNFDRIRSINSINLFGNEQRRDTSWCVNVAGTRRAHGVHDRMRHGGAVRRPGRTRGGEAAHPRLRLPRPHPQE